MRLDTVLAILLLPALLQPVAAMPVNTEGRPDQEKLDRGISLAVAAEFEEALEIFEEVLDENPGHPLVHYYVGLTLFRLERAEGAMYHLERAVAAGAEFPQVYFWLAQAHWNRGDSTSAVDTLAAGLDRFPRNEDLIELQRALTEASDGDR